MKPTNTSIDPPIVTRIQSLFAAFNNVRRAKSNICSARLCIAALIYTTSLSSAGFCATTITFSKEVQSVGGGVTASNSPYINAGYDLYSTTALSNDSKTGADGDGAFFVGTRLSSLPSFITSVTSGGSNSSAGGFERLYADIDNPAGGTVQAGFTYNYSSSPSSELDLVNITIGTGVPSSFYIGALINTSSSQDDDDDMRLIQTTGGSANSGLIYTRNIDYGDVDLVLFEVAGAVPGDVYTLSGVESQSNPSKADDYHVALAGLTFSASAVPEPNSGFLFVLAFIGLTSFYKSRR